MQHRDPSPLHHIPTGDDLSARLAEQTWRWIDGDTGAVLLWLQQLGCVILERPERSLTWILRGIAGGSVTALTTGGQDPIAVASALGFLCGGMLWPQAFPSLLQQVNAEWGRRTKTAKHTRTTHATKEAP